MNPDIFHNVLYEVIVDGIGNVEPERAQFAQEIITDISPDYADDDDAYMKKID